MTLSHGELIGLCVQILDGFDDESYAAEDRITEFMQYCQCLNERDETFIKEVFSGCVQYASVLNVVLNGFYNSDGRFALKSDQELYKVLAYLVLFRLDELGLTHLKKFVKSQNIRKTYLFLNFLLNEKNLLTWMKDEWNKLYESEFVQSSLLQPLQRWLPDLQKVVDRMRCILDNTIPAKKCFIPTTVTKPFDMTPVKPKKVPVPYQIPLLSKCKPAPATTYSCPKTLEVLDKIKESNRIKSLCNYEWTQNNSLSCAQTGKSAKTLMRMQEIVDAENSKLCFEGCIAFKPLPSSAMQEGSVPVKLTTAAILREEKLYRKREEEELKKLQRLEAGEGVPTEFLEWQARMRKLDREKELEMIELRRLAGLLSQEEAVIARQKLVQFNKERVADMKAEAERLMNDYMEKRLLEEERMRMLMAKVIDTHENAKEAKKQLQAYKARLVQAMNEESRELMRQALEEAAAEMQQKIEVIRQIRAMEASSVAKQPRYIDPTEVAGYGLLCEMSLAELRERLSLLQIAAQEEEMARREQIINEKQTKTEMLLGKLNTISIHRNELSKAAALRSEERKRMKEMKMRPSHPQTEVTCVMTKMLEDRKAERRRLEEELKLGQSPCLSKQRLCQLNTCRKLNEEARWNQLEKQACCQAQMCASNVCPADDIPVSTVKTRTALLAL